MARRNTGKGCKTYKYVIESISVIVLYEKYSPDKER